MVQRQTTTDRMGEWLFLFHVHAKPGVLGALNLGVHDGNPGVEHNGVLDRLLRSGSSRLECRDDNDGQGAEDHRCCVTSCKEGNKNHDRPDKLANLDGEKHLRFEGKAALQGKHHPSMPERHGAMEDRRSKMH